MKNCLTFTCLAGLLAISSLAYAEDGDDAAKHAKDFHMGIAAGLNTGGFAISGGSISASPFGGGSLMLPIDIGGVVRLEPELGYAHFSDTDTAPNEASDTTSANVVRAGIGAFYWFSPATDIGAYVGARLGPSFVFGSQSQVDALGNEASTSVSRIDFNVGPAFGAEYFLSPNFSLGAEAQINFTVTGDETVDVEPNPGVPLNEIEDSGLISSTNAMIAMRVFFL